MPSEGFVVAYDSACRFAFAVQEAVYAVALEGTRCLI